MTQSFLADMFLFPRLRIVILSVLQYLYIENLHRVLTLRVYAIRTC